MSATSDGLARAFRVQRCGLFYWVSLMSELIRHARLQKQRVAIGAALFTLIAMSIIGLLGVASVQTTRHILPRPGRPRRADRPYGLCGRRQKHRGAHPLRTTRLHRPSPRRSVQGHVRRPAPSDGHDSGAIARFVDGDLKREAVPGLGITATEAQQTIGDWGRNGVRRDLWLSLWLAKADAILAAGGRVVQESVRFADEAAAIKARGGILIEVRRPGYGPLSGHASEAVPAPGNFILDNSDDLVGMGRRGLRFVDNLCLQTPQFSNPFLHIS